MANRDLFTLIIIEVFHAYLKKYSPLRSSVILEIALWDTTKKSLSLNRG